MDGRLVPIMWHVRAIPCKIGLGPFDWYIMHYRTFFSFAQTGIFALTKTVQESSGSVVFQPTIVTEVIGSSVALA